MPGNDSKEVRSARRHKSWHSSDDCSRSYSVSSPPASSPASSSCSRCCFPINIILGFGFILVSGFALLPAMIAVVITEAFYIRSILAYAVAGGLAGLCCYLGFIPFDTVTWSFDGIVRRHLEVMVGAGILGGVIYWMIAGRNAGAWRDAGRDPRVGTPTR
jgi:hypothetical protein